MTFAQVLMLGSALVAIGLGAGHLMMTFLAGALDPRDAPLRRRLDEVSPVISTETTMWKSYLGFNASHALGVLVFGAVYADLALSAPELLFHSRFLGGLGFAALLAYLWLAWRYWFRLPLAGVGLSLLLYAGGFAAAWG